MTNMMGQVKNLWVLERHPKGALACTRMLDVLERNYRRWEAREKDAGWEPLGIFPTLETAQEGERTLKRRYAAIKNNEQPAFAEKLRRGDSGTESGANNEGNRKVSECDSASNDSQGGTPAEQENGTGRGTGRICEVDERTGVRGEEKETENTEKKK